MSSVFVLQVFYKDGSLTNNNSVTFPDWSFVYGENSVFMPTWLSKYSKDSEGNRFLHSRVSVRVRVRERVRVLSTIRGVPLSGVSLVACSNTFNARSKRASLAPVCPAALGEEAVPVHLSGVSLPACALPRSWLFADHPRKQWQTIQGSNGVQALPARALLCELACIKEIESACAHTRTTA